MVIDMTNGAGGFVSRPGETLAQSQRRLSDMGSLTPPASTEQAVAQLGVVLGLIHPVLLDGTVRATDRALEIEADSRSVVSEIAERNGDLGIAEFHKIAAEGLRKAMLGIPVTKV